MTAPDTATAECPDQTLIAVVRKSNDEEIRVRVGDFHQYRVADVRAFIRAKERPGTTPTEATATKKGLCFTTDKVPAVIAALVKLCHAENIPLDLAELLGEAGKAQQ